MFQSLQAFGHALFDLAYSLMLIAATMLPVVVWLIVCLFAINWKRMWWVLQEGAWVPLTLILILVAMVWSLAVPQPLNIGDIFTLPNFWWQLAAVLLIAGSALFCGWVQTNFSWHPAEIEVEPPQHRHDDHDHGHHPETLVQHDTPALD